MSILNFLLWSVAVLIVFTLVAVIITAFKDIRRKNRYLDIVDKHINEYAAKEHNDTVRKLMKLRDELEEAD